MRCLKCQGCPWGDRPYEKYIPGTEELHLLKRDDSQMYEIYWEVLCHFHICAQVTRFKTGGVKRMTWANYLFDSLDEKSGSISQLVTSKDAEIAERISKSMTSYVTESNEDSNRIRFSTTFTTRLKSLFQTEPCWRGF